MKELRTTYKELFERINKNPNEKIFVKGGDRSFAKINSMIHKKSDTYTVAFDNEVSFDAGDKHVFMNAIGEPVFVQDLEPGEEIQTIYDANVRVTSRHNFKKNQDVYDVCIDDPHWYTNDETHGIIHHNTSFALLIASAYLRKHKDAVILFYDSEFGSPQGYFKSFGIDTDRVLHTPIKTIEELKLDLVHQLDGLDKKDKVIVVIDSVGNLASKKELEDTLEDKSIHDMTRAKSLKGLFRMVTPYLTIKDVPMLGINHTYQCGTEEMLVQTPDGNVSLASIKVGDVVMTELGWEAVTFTTSHDDAIITDITMEDGTVLSFTEGHRFKVNGEWKFLSELMPGDELDVKN